jgi:anti-sigma regulatory factor (Ser/Thr protein kinase)
MSSLQKHQKILEIKSEEQVRNAIKEMLEECKSKDLDVTTVMITLLEESLDNIFKYTHSSENAVDILISTLERIYDRHHYDSDEIEAIKIETINEENKLIH